MKILIAALVVVAALGGAGYWYWHTHSGPQNAFRFAKVHKGRLVATVGSTGTLQPREIVDVGAQVVGRIDSIGEDKYTKSGIVDWGSEVEGPVLDKDGKVVRKGTVLAQIDDRLYQAQVNSTEAALESAKADFRLKTAQFEQATNDWERAQKLLPKEGIAKAEYDQFQAAYKTSQASVGVSKAQIGVAEANLKTAQTNLDYTVIRSPVKGVVIDRRVNVGQTVVASLSAPSLFLIAKDLSQMEVWATVNEVDVGKVKKGQDVHFTVDAVPGRVFQGKVVPQGRQNYRFNATMNQNVVTYTVVVSVDNSKLELAPYWTANLTFIVDNKKDVQLVPNAALRWQPSREQIAPDVRDTYFKLKSKKRSTADGEAVEHGFVWVQGDDGYLRYVEIQTGLSDTVNTEVVSVLGGASLPEGTDVIVSEARGAAASAGGANPFVAQPFAPKKKE
jgi:HlyD family secretion protein